MMKNTKGITLVALVITIVILLILAGISIQAITQTNLFDKAKQAKNITENAQKEENKVLSEYIDKMNEYFPETLSCKVKNGEIAIGSYVNYEPETLDENKLATLKNNLNTYSGVANDENNTINPAIKRDNLKWRVLDIDETTGGVRLISAEPTDSKIQLNGYNGYNNAVKLIDDACSTLYNNNLASKVQNLKIEDITKYMTTQPIEDTTEYIPTNIKFPNILKQEKNQTVDGSITQKINLSEQSEFIIGSSQSNTSILKNTYWNQSMNANASFKNKIYYDLFIRKGEDYYLEYWMSSRCLSMYSPLIADFCVAITYSGQVGANHLYNSDNYESVHTATLRPVITLNSNLKLNTENPGEGTENNAYNIKL